MGRQGVGKEHWDTDWFCGQKVILFLEPKSCVHLASTGKSMSFSIIGALQRKFPQV